MTCSWKPGCGDNRLACPERIGPGETAEEQIMGKNRDDKGGLEGPNTEGPGAPQAGDESRYDDALLSANWNPVIDLLAWSCGKTLDDTSAKRGTDMTENDIDAFLDRIYTLGT
jgi:hypothetical protein